MSSSLLLLILGFIVFYYTGQVKVLEWGMHNHLLLILFIIPRTELKEKN